MTAEDALGAAREYYRLARESLDPPYPGWKASTERAIAQALLGILRLQIEAAAPPELLTDQEFLDKVTAMRTQS